MEKPLWPAVIRIFFARNLVGASLALGAIFCGALIQAVVLVAALQMLISGEGTDLTDSRVIVWPLALLAAAAAKAFGIRAVAGMSAEIGKELRHSLIDALSKTDLQSFEQVGPTAMKTAFSADTQSVTRAVSSIVVTANSIFLLSFVMLVGAWIHVETAFIVCGLLGVVQLFVRSMQQKINAMAERVNRLEDRFLERSTALFAAAKDLRVDQRRATDFWNNGIASAIVALRRSQHILIKAVANQMLFFDIAFDITVALITLVMSQYLDWHAAFLFFFLIYFSFERFSALAVGINAVGYGDVALERINMTTYQLPEVDPPLTARDPAETATPFQSLVLDNLTFTYPQHNNGDKPFEVGPLSLTVEAGKIYFLQGGNGAGKSTTLKVICGFYVPNSGKVIIDGYTAKSPQYRRLFSIVLTDFHLFERLYQLQPGDEKIVQDWLERLHLDGVVALEGDRFSTTALSTGQRKRLALIAAILQKRPILVLDEWTADQDPEFREYFFTRILPQLQSQGTTVIAVTHDDSYFEHCDVMLKVENGRITSLRQHGGEPATDHRLRS